ncbi:MAG: ferritin [Eubacteriales bacterium]|nr:ferritin [Eubacteriales bacterium]
MKEPLSRAFSAQINKEYFSAFFYLVMSDYLDAIGFKGAASWTYVQYQEELAHAQNLVHYLHARNENVKYMTIADPSGEWNGIKDVFLSILKHEESVTESISELATLAMQSGDHAAYTFLHWYIAEQVEEEGNVQDVIDKLQIAEDNQNALLTIDNLLGARVYVEPIVPGVGTSI